MLSLALEAPKTMAFDVLHRDVVITVVFTLAVYPSHIRMIEMRDNSRLINEHTNEAFLMRKMGKNPL